MSDANRLLAAALRYVARGLRVLPLAKGGKVPLVDHGVHDASADVDVVRAWWRRWPRANVAIAVPPAWLVVDVDPRNGGDESLFALEAQHGELPATLVARTGSGGMHIVLARPEGVDFRGKLARGIDLLGAGRYIVAAPSVHPSGGAYVWTSPRGTPIAPAPAWLVALAARDQARDAVPTARSAPTSSIVERARRYLEKCPPAISGSGGHTTTFVIAQRLVRGFGLDEQTSFSLMVEWNRTCAPPWSARDLARKIKEAARAGTMPYGALVNAPERRSA
jgi:hypothetical protein